MRRSLWNRTLSAIFAVWLALVMGETSVVHHHCPMHDGPLPASGLAHGTHDGHAGHAAHGEHDDHDGSTGHGHHVCTCIGACSASSGAIALSEPVEFPAAVIAFVETAGGADHESRPTQHPSFTLPFANGPPGAIA
jgi:DUF2946 family protein